MISDSGESALLNVEIFLCELVINMFRFNLLPFLSNQLPIERFQYRFDLIVSLLRNSYQLHVVLFEVLCHVLRILERRQHHVISQLIYAVTLRFEAVLQDLLIFNDDIVKNFPSINIF